jgi:tetratricopeptide (TPR) repeat protein
MAMSTNPQPTPGEDIKSLEAKGWDFLAKEDYDAALTAFARVFQIDPSNVAAFQGTVAVYRKRRDFARAEGLLAKALRLHPDEPGLLAERFWLELARRRYDEALAALDAVLNVYKTDEGLYLWKTSLLRGRRRFDEAEKVIEETRRLFPDSVRARAEHGWLLFSQKRYDESLDAFEGVLRSEARHESALQGRVASLRMKGCYLEARARAKEALKELPESPGLWSESAWLHGQQGSLDEAVRDFDQVLSLTRRDPSAHVNLAGALLRRGEDDDLGQAARQCRVALSLDPDLPEAFALLGVIAARKGGLQEAEAYLLHSARLDPLGGPQADLGALYLQMGRYEEAKEKIDRAVRNDPADAYPRVLLGKYYLLTEKPKKAIREFRAAAALEPTGAEPHHTLAVALMENDELEEAETVLREAIGRLDGPRRWQLHLTLCQLLTRLGDTTGEARYYEEALEEVGKARRGKPGNPAAYFYSGVVRYKLGDSRGALKDFGRCGDGNEYSLRAELNAKRVRARLREERAQARASGWISALLALVLLVQLGGLWALRVWTDKVAETTLAVLVPVLLGLLVVALVLPWLTRLKMTGLEAELSEAKPREALPTGPQGDVGFGNIAPKSG